MKHALSAHTFSWWRVLALLGMVLAAMVAAMFSWLMYGDLFTFPASAGQVVWERLESEGATGFTITERVWSAHCCAQGKLIEPRRANHARYFVTARYADGTSKKLVFELEDTRGEEVFLTSGWGQRWEVEEIYQEGDALPSLIWET